MLWRRKQADKAAGERDLIRPAEVTAPLEPAILGSKLEKLLEAVEDQGGLDRFLDALRTKQDLFVKGLDEQVLSSLSPAGLDALLETVFSARRRLPGVVGKLGHEQMLELLRELLYGTGAVRERLEAFVQALPVGEAHDKAQQKAINKLRRAAWDLGAEVLHFSNMEKYPLMVRWVWDTSTESGAMREFLRGADTLREVPYDGRPEVFEGFRVWMTEQLAELGFYRDIPMLIDLLLAWAYSDYMRAMSNHMGMIEAEFGGKNDPTELIQKFLGIDPARRHGSRLKKETVH